MVLTQLEKEERSWGSLLAELGFNENPKEKGKKMVDDASQQIVNPTKTDQKDKNKEMSVVNKPEQRNVDPETPCIKNIQKNSVICLNALLPRRKSANNYSRKANQELD